MSWFRPITLTPLLVCLACGDDDGGADEGSTGSSTTGSSAASTDGSASVGESSSTTSSTDPGTSTTGTAATGFDGEAICEDLQAHAEECLGESEGAELGGFCSGLVECAADFDDACLQAAEALAQCLLDTPCEELEGDPAQVCLPAQISLFLVCPEIEQCAPGGTGSTGGEGSTGDGSTGGESTGGESTGGGSTGDASTGGESTGGGGSTGAAAE